MDYNKLYNRIIDRAQHRNVTGYTERHHITPRSLGGSDDADNLANLTAREHFICHYLLAKMYKPNTYKWYKMNNAFMMMKSANNVHHRYYNSRLYEALRKNFSEVMSKSQIGESNSQHGTCWIHNLDIEQSKKIKKEELNDYLAQGWLSGRVQTFINYYNRKCKVCGNKFRAESTKSICGTYCKKQYRVPAYRKLIDDNFKDLIKVFKTTRSISKTLTTIGLNSKTREGNRYFSQKVKNLGYDVLKRRNTPN